jgi:hypothetical protein
LTIVQAVDGKFPHFLRLFFTFWYQAFMLQKQWKNYCNLYTFLQTYCLWNVTQILHFWQLNVWQIVCYSNQFFFKLSVQCLYDRMEKNTFFAEQLFDKNSNLPLAFWSILPVKWDRKIRLFWRTIVWREFKLAYYSAR